MNVKAGAAQNSDMQAVRASRLLDDRGMDIEGVSDDRAVRRVDLQSLEAGVRRRLSRGAPERANADTD